METICLINLIISSDNKSLKRGSRKKRKKLEETKAKENEIEEEIEHTDINYNITVKNPFKHLDLMNPLRRLQIQSRPPTVPLQPNNSPTHKDLINSGMDDLTEHFYQQLRPCHHGLAVHCQSIANLN